MRFGLALPSYSFADLDYPKAARLHDFAAEAEARGYESLWAIEHLLTARGLYGTAWLSPLETLSFAAGCTSQIALATGILIAALRNPVFVAKEIASLQFLSGGRFELGIGVGWDAHEYEVAGVPLRERGRRTDEILGIFERLWTGEPVTHHGRYYHFDDVVIDPPLPKKPPLWLAGGSKIVTELSPDPENMAPTVLERICRHGDGWLARAAGSTDSVIADWAQIQGRLAELGRAPESVIFGHLNFLHVVPTDDAAVAHRVQIPWASG
jgi:probable F420-dependent oxidoreductase